ncbi:MAG: hypothetical protein PF961_00135 [Planctomycetota bacterium]|jgi:hypothetical protein|nr:hypothetical protein [Planctomycetota bacterium]
MRTTNVAVSLILAIVATSSLSAVEGDPLDPSTIVTFRPYPIATCLVSDEAIGSMKGMERSFVYAGQEVTVCCNGCIKKFAAQPDLYLKKMKRLEGAAHGESGPMPHEKATMPHEKGAGGMQHDEHKHKD